MEQRNRYNPLSIPPSPRPTPRQTNPPILQLQLSARGKTGSAARLALNLNSNPNPAQTPRSLSSTPRPNMGLTPRRFNPNSNAESTPRFTFRTNLLMDASAASVQTPRNPKAGNMPNMSIAENAPFRGSTEDLNSIGSDMWTSPLPLLRKKASSGHMVTAHFGSTADMGIAGVALTDRSERSTVADTRFICLLLVNISKFVKE